MDKEYSLTLNGVTVLAKGEDAANVVRYLPEHAEERFYFSVAAMYEILRKSQVGNVKRRNKPYKSRTRYALQNRKKK